MGRKWLVLEVLGGGDGGVVVGNEMSILVDFGLTLRECPKVFE